MQAEENMEERPKPRIWDGADYDSDPEEDKHWTKFSNPVGQHAVKTEMR